MPCICSWLWSPPLLFWFSFTQLVFLQDRISFHSAFLLRTFRVRSESGTTLAFSPVSFSSLLLSRLTGFRCGALLQEYCGQYAFLRFSFLRWLILCWYGSLLVSLRRRFLPAYFFTGV